MNTALPTKFVSQPSTSLFCSLCQKLFQDPVISIGCGHTFCRNCIDNRLLVMTHLTCPVDNVRIELNNIVPNRAVQGQLEDLLIYCCHGLNRTDSDDEFELEDGGCKEQISLGKRYEHEEHCLMAWVPCTNCSNQCGKFRKKDLTAHLTNCLHHICPNENKGEVYGIFIININGIFSIETHNCLMISSTCPICNQSKRDCVDCEEEWFATFEIIF